MVERLSTKVHTLAKHEASPISAETSQRIAPRHVSFNGESAETCTSDKCKQWADLVRTNLAPNYTAIDPCEDFSAYACDGWRAHHDYRADQASISIGSIMSDTNRNILHSILTNPYPVNSSLSGDKLKYDKANFDKMKAAYDTCMNEDKIKEYGVAPLVKILNEFDKVYPVKGPNPTKDNKEELTNALIWLANNDVSGLVSSGNGADDSNPDVVIISLGGGETNFAKQYYNNTKVMANYTRVISQMQQVVDSGKPIFEIQTPAGNNKAFDTFAATVVNFEKVISAALPDPDAASEVKYYYRPRTIDQIQPMVPQIDLIKYLQAQAPKEYPITGNRTVIMSDENYYKALSGIIEKAPRETLHSYFRQRLLATWSGRLHQNYTLPLRQLRNEMAGKDPNNVPERWRGCVGEIDSTFGLALSAAFIERAFTTADKEFGDRIIMDIKKFFAARLKSFNWMSESVKEQAAKKVVNIMQKVGYQTSNPNVAEPKEVNDWYSKLAIGSNTSWFENGRLGLQWGMEKSRASLLKPVDRARWGMSAPTVNAYYSPSGNEIVFPAGIMQFPVFGSALPEYVSYGSFGAVAGHELTHGFDDHGSEFDEHGVLRNWWDNTTRTNFEKKTQCFVKQYGDYTVPGLDGQPLHVNGKLTLGENIADAGGLTAAYAAWKKRDTDKPDPMLPGLESFNKDQLFFLSYATWWCGKVRPAQAVNYIYTDAHSPSDKRIIGTTANSKAFKEAFNCKKKEPTCELW
ncbi:zincin [Microthyrium microscopicum]|uniref:Zincin n=1 Tax=Microthyrium microscopicum TaxID=703497 RepID=A0A6A6UHN4_9PEZI|nr:zincin [Microthyrium microscopicum]